MYYLGSPVKKNACCMVNKKEHIRAKAKWKKTTNVITHVLMSQPSTLVVVFRHVREHGVTLGEVII